MTDSLLGKWHYRDVENDIQQHALRSAANYNERKPLSFIPNERAGEILKHIGATMSDISRLVDYNYQTVVGWFHRINRLTRSTVAGDLFPTLCEAYVQFHGPRTRKYARSHYEYMMKGSPIDESYRLAVERHIAYLICTGDPFTPEMSRQFIEEGRGNYERAIIRFAASFLEKEELDTVALSCMGILHRHRNMAAHEPEDLLEKVMDSIEWCFWVDDESQRDYLDLSDNGKAIGNALSPQAMLINHVASIRYLEQQSIDDLIFTRTCVDRLIDSRGDLPEDRHILSTASSYLEKFSL